MTLYRKTEEIYDSSIVGVMNGFEVPFPDSDWERQYMVDSNTWGYDWQVENILDIILIVKPKSKIKVKTKTYPKKLTRTSTKNYVSA